MTALRLPVEMEVAEGQIWRERDPRCERFVKVLMLLRPNGLKVRTCDISGDFKRGSRESEVSRSRFVKAFNFIRAD